MCARKNPLAPNVDAKPLCKKTNAELPLPADGHLQRRETMQQDTHHACATSGRFETRVTSMVPRCVASAHGRSKKRLCETVKHGGGFCTLAIDAVHNEQHSLPKELDSHKTCVSPMRQCETQQTHRIPMRPLVAICTANRRDHTHDDRTSCFNKSERPTTHGTHHDRDRSPTTRNHPSTTLRGSASPLGGAPMPLR